MINDKLSLAVLIFLTPLMAQANQPDWSQPRQDVESALRLVEGEGDTQGRLERLAEQAASRGQGEMGELWRWVAARAREGDGAQAEQVIRDRLLAAQGELEALEALGEGEPEGLVTPRATLEEILARPEFQPLPQSEAWERPWGSCDREKWDLSPDCDCDEAFKDNKGQGLMAGDLFSSLVVFMILLGLILVVYSVLAHRSTRLFEKERPSQAPQAMEGHGADALEHSPEGWLTQAEDLAGRGQFREAIRALYLSTLVALHRSRVIEYDKTRTNWQYLRFFHGRQEQRPLFQRMTVLFERVWYGRDATGLEDYSAFRDVAVALIEAARSGGVG